MTGFGREGRGPFPTLPEFGASGVKWEHSTLCPQHGCMYINPDFSHSFLGWTPFGVCLPRSELWTPDSASPTGLDWREPCGSSFQRCPSSSCSRSSLQHPQPPAGLPGAAHPASTAHAGLQALARLPLQWHHPAQSLPQLQHGMRLGRRVGACASVGVGKGRWFSWP